MNIIELFLDFALLGAEWVLWLLVALSVLSVGVMVERFRFFHSRQVNTEHLAHAVKKALASGTTDALRRDYGGSDAMAARVALRAVEERERGVDAVGEAMNSEKIAARGDHERYLIVLGTLGNNAPFIGLFGTVLGIIVAFNDLAEDSGGGADVVMAGISEALVATAVGLLVAIPAVVAFNYFNRRVRAALSATDEIAHAILAELHAGKDAREGA
jgi:biopolymer transport protein ExbB/TolQ